MSISEEKHKTTTSFLLPFEKMHGLGNDFVMVNANHLPENPEIPQQDRKYEIELTRKICSRNTGVGADGLIIIDTVRDSEEAIRSWRYYNSDGSVGEMCGNGIRCAAKYIYEHGLSGEDTQFKIETLAGDIGVDMQDEEQVKVDMGEPRSIEEKLSLSVTKGSDRFDFSYDFISMGNPHAVAFYDCSYAELQQLSQWGPLIELHNNFPNKTNVEFARVISPMKIELIVWERGCGFTQACGTGACATAISAILRGFCAKDSDIEVVLPGGSLTIRWDSVTNSIFMTGPAVMSFTGYYNEEK